MSPSEQASSTNNEQQQPTFKEQLDQAAHDARHPGGKGEEAQPSIVKKVTEYVPAAAKILGTGTQENTKENTPAKNISGPPDRPKHDGHIEEFMRDQHRSKRPDPEFTK